MDEPNSGASPPTDNQLAAAAAIRAEGKQASKNLLLTITLGVALLLLGLVTCSRPFSGSSRSGSDRYSDLQYKVAAKALVQQFLRDPSSAEFTRLTVNRPIGKSAVVCGLVNSRNGFGGMSGPVRFISGDRVIVEGQISAPEMDAEWARNC